MKQISTVLLPIIMAAIIISFGFNNSISQVTDYDGNVYKTVTIGNQEWMAENLNVEHYRNGDVIPQVQDYEIWSKLTTGAWCYYDNDSKNGKTYGKLYNWYSVNDSRGLAPEGWHIASDEEWTQLTDYLGGVTKESYEEGAKWLYIESVGGKLKSTTLWKSPNEGVINSSGFMALPSGLRFNDGGFDYVGRIGIFWLSSEYDNNKAWNYGLYNDYSEARYYFTYKICGFSVRCVKD